MLKTKTKMKEFVSWDTLSIIENQKDFLLENAENDSRELTEDEAFNEASQDSDIFEWAWDDLCLNLTGEMKMRNPSGQWKAQVKGFGWRGLDGWKEFHAETGKDFLSEILPQTDCTFKVYLYKKRGFAINNAHHDAPMWTEWYYIEPMEVK